MLQGPSPHREWSLTLLWGCTEHDKKRLTFLFLNSERTPLQHIRFYLNDHEGKFLYLPRDQYTVQKVDSLDKTLPFEQQAFPVSFLIREGEYIDELVCQIESPETFFHIPDIAYAFDLYDGWRRVFVRGDPIPSTVEPIE